MFLKLRVIDDEYIVLDALQKYEYVIIVMYQTISSDIYKSRM